MFPPPVRYTKRYTAVPPTPLLLLQRSSRLKHIARCRI